MSNTKEYQRQNENSKYSKIVIDRDLCIGAASCIAVAGSTFELDNENKVIVLDANIVDDETLLMAAESCPTKAILLYDEGWSPQQIAKALLISDQAVRNHVEDYKVSHKLKPENGGSDEMLSEKQSEKLEAYLQYLLRAFCGVQSGYNGFFCGSF